MLKRMRPKASLCFLVIVMVATLFFSLPVLANNGGEKLNLRDGLKDFLTGSTMGNKPIGFVIGRIMKGAFVALGLVCLVIFIIAGFQWMTSGGNKDKIQSAQKSMRAAIIGLIIVIIARAAIDFITSALESVTG